MKKILKLSQVISKHTKLKDLDLEFLSAIFDAGWYLRSNPDIESVVRTGKTSAFKHFLEHGAAEGRRPNVIFDYSYIASANTMMPPFDNNSSIILKKYGEIRNRALIKSHPLFDPLWYLQNNADAEAQLVEGSSFPLKHYLTVGALEGRSPNEFFNAKWYLENYPDAGAICARDNMSALEHYVTIGNRLQYSPSSEFNAGWYLREYADVKNMVLAGITDPLSHFLVYGFGEGRVIKSHASKSSRSTSTYTNLTRKSDKNVNQVSHCHTFSNLWTLSEAPLVSIVIVNHNGAHHLEVLLHSLKEQTYKNFELIFVDNASSDNSCEIIENSDLRKRIIRNASNDGFAAANNIGARQSSGELIAVLNNDTRLDPNWLEAMVNVLANDSTVGAVTPKLRFWTKFVNIKIRSQYTFNLDRTRVLDSLNYKKFFINTGREENFSVAAVQSDSDFIVSINIPVQREPVAIELTVSNDEQLINIEYGFQSKSFITEVGSGMLRFEYVHEASIFEKFIINNAGSLEYSDGLTADRGFGEFDTGQYDYTEEIDLICGCAALIRRDALLGYDLFQSEFVAYYEDSELSKRIKLSGSRILYCPLAIVYHKHSATSVEKSQFWMTYVNRNEVLYRYMFASEEIRDQLLISKMHAFQHHSKYFENIENIKSSNDANYAASLNKIMHDLPILAKKIKDGDLPRKSVPRIGLFNNHWRTLGGGEAHALSLLQILCPMGIVDLISVADFNLDSTLSYFGMSSVSVRKRLILDLEPEITREYDIFINSSYMNECPSWAQYSYYLVSFPSKTPPHDFLKSYIFLANSTYTLSWMRKYWGDDNFEARTLNPAISDKLLIRDPIVPGDKCKIILSVGRFFRGGHSKNQHIIAEIFKEFVINHGYWDWKLVLAGSSNDSKYVEDVRTILSGYNAEVLTDLSINDLSLLYRSSFFYIHASGFGKHVDDEPENFEHFGMTVVEAALNGCIPIVYDAAGPKEIIENIGFGHCFNSTTEASEFLRIEAEKYQTSEDRANISIVIRRMAESKFHMSGSSKNREILANVLREIMEIGGGNKATLVNDQSVDEEAVT